jgi:transcriptional antiterminator Rof (Rho-off)
VDSDIACDHDAAQTGEACMGEGATFIRREGVKQECIALQMEGDDEARLLLYAQ